MSSLSWMKCVLWCASENLFRFEGVAWEFRAHSIGYCVSETCHRRLCHWGRQLAKQNQPPVCRSGVKAAMVSASQLTKQNRPRICCSGVQARLVSASNPDHVTSGCGSSGLVREEMFSWRHSTGTCWYDILSSLVCRSIEPRAVKVWKRSRHSPVVPRIHKYGFCWKVLFFDECAEIHLLQNSEYSGITATLCLCLWVGAMCPLKCFLDPCPLDALILVMPVRNASWKPVISGFSRHSYSLCEL